MRNWIKQIEEKAQTTQTNTCKVLVGNKCEKPDRVVTKEEGQILANDFNLSFFEASNQNINEIFNYLNTEIMKLN